MQSDIEPCLDSLRFSRHQPDALATFAVRVSIPGVVDGLTLATPSERHDTQIDPGGFCARNNANGTGVYAFSSAVPGPLWERALVVATATPGACV